HPFWVSLVTLFCSVSPCSRPAPSPAASSMHIKIGGRNGSLYFRPAGPDAGQIQDSVRPDQTADRLLRDRRTDRCAGLLFCPGQRQPEPCRSFHDRGHAPVLFLWDVRAQRPAARGGGPAVLSGPVCPAESSALPHQQLLCRSHAAGRRPGGGDAHCSKSDRKTSLQINPCSRNPSARRSTAS